MPKEYRELCRDIASISLYRLIIDLIVITILSILFIPHLSKAQTDIKVSDMKANWVWDKEGSPYILRENIYVPKGYNLTIGEGVEVIADVDPDGEEYNYLGLEGDLYINGTKENPVKFTNVPSIDLSNNIAEIKNTVLDGTSIYISNSTTTLEGVTIKNTIEAVSAVRSKVNITDSNLINNTYGIFSRKYSPIFQVKNDLKLNDYGIGGDGDIENAVNDFDQNIIKIKNSNILHNSKYGILNQTNNVIDARENWWGSPDGPTSNQNSGLINFEPWKTVEVGANRCCSNVLFVPGLKASRLYIEKYSNNATSSERLWEPGADNDVKKLYMDSLGASVNSYIYSRDIIDSAFSIPGFFGGFKNIYKSFILMMDEMVTGGKIKEWLALPYDWRLNPEDLVSDEVIQKVIKLSESSMTGRIVIIAHSNGGLVTKSLAKKLEEVGKANIIENIIFVAVPEIGTPQAIFAMLHGYEQALFLGRFPTEKVARVFSQNLPGAYSLLPSKKYFDKDYSGVITDFFTDLNGKVISSFEKLRDFVLNNGFSKISSNDLNTPLKLNSNLFSIAEDFHDKFDSWLPASTTRFKSIIGWGIFTPKKLTYLKGDKCGKNIEKCDIDYQIKNTKDGDGTVLSISNSGKANETEYMNLSLLGEEKDKKITHVNILESGELLEKIKDEITGEENGDESYEKYFSNTMPISTEEDLTILVHSPLDIHIYDSKGRHTGPLDESTPKGKYIASESEIPGTVYGDMNGTKMIALPYSNLDDYKITLDGTGVGTFRVEASISVGDEILDNLEFDTMPVTPLTNIDLIIATSSEDFASSSMMYIDMNSDGVADIIHHTDTYNSENRPEDLHSRLMAIRHTIISLSLPANVEKNWLNRVDKLVKVVEKNKNTRAEKITRKIINRSIKNKKISDSQKSEMLKVLGELLTALESDK